MNGITMVGIVVSAAAALIIAYLHRKQMRQIELYKQDPSVGLVPPPTAFTRFVKLRWLDVLGYAVPFLNLVIELNSDGPITRFSVLVIASSVALLVVIFSIR
jgi:hypothetical protein